jgi:hypothetical protein
VAARADASGPSPSRALSYLQDDYERIFPERVRLARYGEVRYAARDRRDAAGEGDRSDRIDMDEAPAFVVVDQVRDRVRVIAPQDHYRLLLWIDVRDLYTVVTEQVLLAPDRTGAKAGQAGAIRLHPGLPVEIGAEQSGMAHVRHRDECVSFSGLVARAALGTQFVPTEVAALQASGVVGAGSPVQDRPGGREVARFLADCEVADSGPERDGHRPILYATEWFELRGWVAAGGARAASGASGGGSWGYGLGHLGLWGARSRLRLSEGTCLHARRGGPAIGVVTEDTDAPLSPPVDGWWQLPLETGWGDLAVWVAEDSAATAADRREGTGGDEAPGGARGEADGEAGGEGDELGVGTPGAGEPDRPSLRRCR